jgi:hypothetical protein
MRFGDVTTAAFLGAPGAGGLIFGVITGTAVGGGGGLTSGVCTGLVAGAWAVGGLLGACAGVVARAGGVMPKHAL